MSPPTYTHAITARASSASISTRTATTMPAACNTCRPAGTDGAPAFACCYHISLLFRFPPHHAVQYPMFCAFADDVRRLFPSLPSGMTTLPTPVEFLAVHFVMCFCLSL